MRILYIDIDSLRPDHLGCYGYHRHTSPNIDALARESVRFDNLYVPNAPCLPSRTALWSGRFGFQTGVVGHGGTAAEPFIEGPARGFRDLFATTGWMSALRRAGLKTVTISSFGERHAAWHWYAGYNEIYNPGYGGLDDAHQVTPIALDWIKRHGRDDNWFLHVNLWDPHTPYSTPAGFGNPYADEPLAGWLTEDVRQRQWAGFGPHSPQEPQGWGDETDHQRFPRVPAQLDSMENVKKWIDGYDVGIRYADEHIGQIINALAEAGVLDETVIMIGADHGENQGELNVWGDHQTADAITCRVPLLVRWPGLNQVPRVDSALYYHFDWAATLIEMVGGNVPDNWAGRPFTTAFRNGQAAGRPYLVISQNAWACQRAVRFDDYLCIRTYHDGYKQFEPVMLFNLAHDPHEQHNLAGDHPEVVARAMSLLAGWQHDMMRTSPQNVDPMMTVLREGGPFHSRGRLPAYLDRLKATGRARHAETLAARHPDEM